jgi:hypothetical protein
MALVRCEIADGPRPEVKDVRVQSLDGYELLAIEEHYLVHRDDGYYLPVGFLGTDQGERAALVLLPLPAHSGANRVWVRADQILIHCAGSPDQPPTA